MSPLPTSPLPASQTGSIRMSLRIMAIGIGAGSQLGVMTNAFNGWLSPLYFITTLKWQSKSNIWAMSIAQGALEGFVCVTPNVFQQLIEHLPRAACRSTGSRMGRRLNLRPSTGRVRVGADRPDRAS